MFSVPPIKVQKHLKKLAKKNKLEDFFDEIGSPGEIRCLFDKNRNYVGIPGEKYFPWILGIIGISFIIAVSLEIILK